MTVHLYRGHWELILAKLTESPDRFSEAVTAKVQKAIESQPDAVCVAVDGQSVGFRTLAGLIQGAHEELADMLLMQCAAEMWFQRWDEVEDGAFVSGGVK